MTLPELKDFMRLAQMIQERMDFESALYDELIEDNHGVPKGLSEALDNLIDIMDEHTGGEWVSWYIFENYFGTGTLTAAVGDEPPAAIDTVEKLYAIIVATEKTNG